MTNTPGKFDLYFIFCQLRIDDPIKMHKIFFENRVTKIILPVSNGQSEQFSLKSIKEIYIPAKIINPCQFITDPFKVI